MTIIAFPAPRPVPQFHPATVEFMVSAGLLRSLWPLDESGTPLPLRRWAREIGITPYVLALFLAAAAYNVTCSHIGRVGTWIEAHHGEDLRSHWELSCCVGHPNNPANHPFQE